MNSFSAEYFIFLECWIAKMSRWPWFDISYWSWIVPACCEILTQNPPGAFNLPTFLPLREDCCEQHLCSSEHKIPLPKPLPHGHMGNFIKTMLSTYEYLDIVIDQIYIWPAPNHPGKALDPPSPIWRMPIWTEIFLRGGFPNIQELCYLVFWFDTFLLFQIRKGWNNFHSAYIWILW